MTSREEALAMICRTNLEAYFERAFMILHPGLKFDSNWHIGCIAEHLMAVERGEIKRIIINEPPRMLKSETCAQMYPTWVQGRNPSHQFICATFAGKLARRNTMAARKIIRDQWYQAVFGGTRLDQEQADHYTLTGGGSYLGSGLTGTITGFGCDTLAIDDPISPSLAASDTTRESTKEWIRSTLFSRFNNELLARIILIMQRVHCSDPSGEFVEQGWHLLKLPAEAPKSVLIRLGEKRWEMKAGDLLFPSRLTKEILLQKKQDLGTYNYYGQYIQEPVPLGGGEFKKSWVQHYANGSIKPKEMNVYILIDQAGGEELNKKKKKLSDWSVIAVVGLGTDNNYYLLDMVRDRFNPTERVETIMMMHRKWNELCGKPPKVGCEQIGLMTDVHYAKEKQMQESYHFPIIPLGSGDRRSKEERIRQLIPVLENGRFYFPEKLLYIDAEGRTWDLVSEIITSELTTFPRSKYDDMIDDLSRILDEDLSATFPMPKTNMVSRARRRARNTGGSWEDF